MAKAGADAIGFNFYERSLRSVHLDRAREISQSLSSGICKVGVFVNSSAEQMVATFEHAQLDGIQLHGDEPLEIMAALREYPIIRAIRFANHPSDTNQQIEEWADAGAAAVLIDAAQPGQFGGTGKQVDWNQVVRLVSPVPIILAGGLRPDNVSESIRIARPVAVDTASGVETFPGKKSSELVHEFVDQAIQAFKNTDG